MNQSKILNTLDRLEAISTHNSMEQWQADVLKIVSNNINADKAAFFSQSQNAKPKMISRNIQTSKCLMYMEYFYSLDPLGFIADHRCGLSLNRGPNFHKKIVNLEEVVERATLAKSEYYNDFLKPQRIYHETILYLSCETNSLCTLSVMRNNTKDFSYAERNILKSISPYLSTCLNNIILRQKNRTNELVLNLPEAQPSSGIIILNADMQVLYKNAKAEELFAKDGDNIGDILAPCIAENFQILKQNTPISEIPSLPVRCKVQVDNRSLVVFIRQIKPIAHRKANDNFFAVSIEPASSSRFSRQKIQAFLSLTKRETEIVENILKGLRNAQIAEKLFVSEVTVKKHIQNILRKTGLKSRTAIVHKLLTMINIL